MTNHVNRVPIKNLEINVSYACNLKCEHCTHLGSVMRGIATKEELHEWYLSWHVKVRPQTVRLMGGEPLLHNDLGKIIDLTKKYWSDSRLELISNGLLFPQIAGETIASIDKHRPVLIITKHFNNKEYLEQFDEALTFLKVKNIPFQIRDSSRRWTKSYEIENNGTKSPYQSNPVKAWQICTVKNRCTTLMHNKLYRCPQLACFTHAYREGLVDERWKVASEYMPLSADCTEKELWDFIQGEHCDQCRVCPDEFQFANQDEKQGRIID